MPVGVLEAVSPSNGGLKCTIESHLLYTMVKCLPNEALSCKPLVRLQAIQPM